MSSLRPRLFQFKEPRGDDSERGRTIQYVQPFASMPGIEYVGCGEIWSSSRGRIPAALPPDHGLRTRRPGPVGNELLAALAASVREGLGLGPEVPIAPGTIIGPQRVKVRRLPLPAFEWPGIHMIVIRAGASRSRRCVSYSEVGR